MRMADQFALLMLQFFATHCSWHMVLSDACAYIQFAGAKSFQQRHTRLLATLLTWIESQFLQKFPLIVVL